MKEFLPLIHLISFLWLVLNAGSLVEEVDIKERRESSRWWQGIHSKRSLSNLTSTWWSRRWWWWSWSEWSRAERLPPDLRIYVMRVLLDPQSELTGNTISSSWFFVVWCLGSLLMPRMEWSQKWISQNNWWWWTPSVAPSIPLIRARKVSVSGDCILRLLPSHLFLASSHLICFPQSRSS